MATVHLRSTCRSLGARPAGAGSSRRPLAAGRDAVRGDREEFHAATAELRERGFGVLIAHPERSADAALDGARGLRREVAAGSEAPLNALSLTGGHGEDPRRAAWALLADGLVSVVASDAHGPSRAPALRLAHRTLREGGMASGPARDLVATGPRRLLASGLGRRAVVRA